MALRSKGIDHIDQSDLQALKDELVPEDQHIEYKEVLPANEKLFKGTPEERSAWLEQERTEFRRDVSAFANAAGGDLIYGISEDRKKGQPRELVGVDISNADAEIRRLHDIIRDSINPRISGISIRPIPLENTKYQYAIIVRVPRSWAAPHMVVSGDDWRFYVRIGAARPRMDVSQLQAVFVGAARIGDQVRSFRLERLGRIASREVPLSSGMQVVLHLVPFRAFDATARFDLVSLAKDRLELKPLIPTDRNLLESWYTQFNFDGLLTLCTNVNTGGLISYLQIFRNGIIEAVASSLDNRWASRGEALYIRSKEFEEMLLDSLERFRLLQQSLGVEPPIIVMLTLLGANGYRLTQPPPESGLTNTMIDRQDLLIPDTVMESMDTNVASILRPLFDIVWNTVGKPQCPYYNMEGKRRGYED